MTPSGNVFKRVHGDDVRPSDAQGEGLERCIDAHSRLTDLWLDQLLEQGDDEDLVSTLHRREAWLSMMEARQKRG